MQIRHIKAGEFEAVAGLVRESGDQAILPLYSQEGIETFREYSQQDAIENRTAENYETMVAIESGAIIGMAHIRESNHIAMLFVSPVKQRAGVARNLLNFILKRSTGSKLTVNSSPNAVAVYLNFGFQQWGDETVEQGIRFVPMMLHLRTWKGEQSAARNGASRRE